MVASGKSATGRFSKNCEQKLGTQITSALSDHYVLVDDKLRILAAVKDVWDEYVTTVFVRQGHFAHDDQAISGYRSPDYTIKRIADLMKLNFGELTQNPFLR